MKKLTKSKAEWKRELDPELYKIAREKGTEAPFSGNYVHTKDEGTYNCSVCGNPLFSSDAKFDSGTGWPSYSEPISPDAVGYSEDKSRGMVRTEITCGKCGSHLGHVFDDGPKTLPDGRQATGKRYCINCVSLDLQKSD